MDPCIWVEKLTFSDGTIINLAKDDIVVIAGPNNSGKSASLRAIRDFLLKKSFESPIVSTIAIAKDGGADDLGLWMETFSLQSKADPKNPVFQAFDAGIHVQEAKQNWIRKDPYLGHLSRFFCFMLSADERLQIAKEIKNIAVTREPLTHPVHYLLRDDKLETKVSDQFKKAFGVDLIVHRNAGNEIPLLTGPRPTPADGQERVSYDYIKELEKLDLLKEQGDGMRSFAGVLLFTLVGRETILLIDEPEAFLHPPQARLLGRMLVTEKPAGRQLFIATHSGDVLRGILDANKSNVQVIRIQRSGSVNKVRELDSTKIKELWKDPLLRYSNILDGIFHEKAIVGESDADCRFYSAVMDAKIEKQGEDARRPDIMFTHCGGKDRLPTVIRALRAVDVPLKVVADFDVLNNERPLRDIVIAAGGEWDTVKTDWMIVNQSIEKKKPELNTEDVKKEIDAILTTITDKVFPGVARKEIEHLLKKSSAWSIAKETGKAFVPSGDETRACDRLLEALRQMNIHVVEVGQAEGFVRSVGNHGPAWVNAVITKDLASDPELETARRFVSLLTA